MATLEPNRRRYESWVRLYAPRLYRFAYRLSGHHQVAEDLIQETFLEAWRGIENLKEEERALGWLFQILRFRHAHYLRDTRRQRQMTRLPENSEEHPPDGGVGPLENLAGREAMQKALDGLSPTIRETFLMVFQEGRTCREVADLLQVPIGTVLSRTDSGRKALRAALGRNGLAHQESAKVISEVPDKQAAVDSGLTQ